MIRGVDTVGRRIEAKLEEKGWRPNRLAAEMDVDTDTVRRWTRDQNKPRLDDVARLAERLGVSIKWLLTGDEDPLVALDEIPDYAGLRAAEHRIDELADRVKRLELVLLDLMASIALGAGVDPVVAGALADLEAAAEADRRTTPGVRSDDEKAVPKRRREAG